MILKLLDDLSEGVTIARPVLVQGRTLLAAGAQLTSKHLKIFKAWGVNEIWIEGEPEKVSNSEPDHQSKEFKIVLEKIDKRFSKCNGNSELISSLKRIAIAREYSIYKKETDDKGESNE